MTASAQTPEENHAPDSSWERFEMQVRAARRDVPPPVDVVERVMTEIARKRPALLAPQERWLLCAAAASAVIAASLMVIVWNSETSLSNPSSVMFQPFVVTLLERP